MTGFSPLFDPFKDIRDGAICACIFSKGGQADFGVHRGKTKSSVANLLDNSGHHLNNRSPQDHPFGMEQSDEICQNNRELQNKLRNGLTRQDTPCAIGAL